VGPNTKLEGGARQTRPCSHLLKDFNSELIMSSVLRLFCWVQGDGPDQAFEVKIDGSDTVSELKDKIKQKKKHAFQDIDASTLMIWKVSGVS
jgi:hypothetical protein